MTDQATIHTLPTAHDLAVQAGHPSVGGPDGLPTPHPLGQEVTVYLTDEEVDILVRTAAIGRNLTLPQVYDDPDILRVVVNMALRLGMKELDAVARSAVTSAFNRAAVRPIREPF